MTSKTYFNKSNFLTLLLFIISLNEKCECLSSETKELVSRWAPVVWIHPEDPFFPSNVDFYLQNMEVKHFLSRNLNEIEITNFGHVLFMSDVRNIDMDTFYV